MSLTVLPLPFNRFKLPNGNGINIVPFTAIFKGLSEIPLQHEFFSDNFQNIIGNVILFIPLGIFAPLLSRKYRSMKRTAILGCACSISIELTQLVLRHFEIYRTVDIDDVILNTLGAMLGFIMINTLYFKNKRII